MNVAQQIRQAFGIEAGNTAALRQRNASATKGGSGRRHAQGDGTGANKTTKQKSAGAYGKGLRNWCNGIAQRKHAANLAKRFTNA
jgi:hypothetical protein